VTEVRFELVRPRNDSAPGWLQVRLDRADRLIDLAWAVAALWGAVRVISALWLAHFAEADELLWLLDPTLILLLAYGLYRRSRACAVLLLVYVVLELWVAYHTRPVAAGVGPAMLLGLAFAAGIRGTFAYHRELAEAPRE
jgi:serine/threonine-protein kinase